MTIESYLRDVADILLSGDNINRIDGQESKDMVIKFTPFPFKPVTFRQYLQSLGHSNRAVTQGKPKN
jgi:hypothetical protein